MASTASSSRLERSDEREAGPLPVKLGELGWTPEADITDAHTASQQENATATAPASSSSSSSHSAATATGAATTATTAATVAATATSSSDSLVATASARKRRGLLYRLSSSNAPPLFWGLSGPSVLRFALIVAALAIIITAWAVSAIRFSHSDPFGGGGGDDNNNSGDSSSDATLNQMQGTMGVFIHVAFGIATLIALVFLERSVFQLRAERWLHTHPGQTLPLHRGGARAAAMGVAPWNRPPLPTYAAALGLRGTGDVEDDHIAPPPPPAYGNTRGSVLLLASALRRLSGIQEPWVEVTQIPNSRPASYVSTTQDQEVREDALRARNLEASLARLEGP